MQQVRSSSGFVPFSAALAPFRAVGEHKGQLGAAPLFSFHLPLGSAGFHRFHRYYEEIRLLLGHGVVVVASFNTSTFVDPKRSPWVRMNGFPPLPSSITVMSRLDIGRRVDEHVRPDTPALQGFAFARCCGFSSASIPHALTGKVGSGSRRFRPHAVAYDLWLPPAGSIRDLHPPPFIHAQAHPVALRAPSDPAEGSLSLPTYSCVDPSSTLYTNFKGEVSHDVGTEGSHSSNAESAISQLSRNTRRGSFTRGKTSTVFELAP